VTAPILSTDTYTTETSLKKFQRQRRRCQLALVSPGRFPRKAAVGGGPEDPRPSTYFAPPRRDSARFQADERFDLA